jgi:hypothetical protein
VTRPEQPPLVRRLRLQADACADLGSPLYGALLHRVADDVLAGGPSATVLAGHEADPGPSALALRLMGAVHRLVLQGQAAQLAAYYPSVGGTADPEGAWRVLRELFASRAQDVRPLLGQAPQTNEVGRAAALVGGLLHVVARTGTPVRLFEIGASAGLNLRADHFRVTAGDEQGVGPPGSPVRLQGAWLGPPPPLHLRLRVVERAGCDTAPLDPTSAEDRLTLRSYVWPDQLPRMERLRGGLEVAARVPAVVRRAPATGFLRELRLRPGTTTVVWHSVMWQYMPREERAAAQERLAQLAAEASPEAPFAHLRFEPARRTAQSEHEFLVLLQVWPGDDARPRVLASAHPHGVPTTWEQRAGE